MCNIRIYLCFICLVLCIMCGCGSLGGSDQIISIDSEYRGEAVYNKDGVHLGNTPLFLKVNPHVNEYLKTKIPQGFQTHEYHCKFRWWQTPLENLPLALLFIPALYFFPSVGLSSVAASSIFIGSGIDTLSGAAFNCPNQVSIPNHMASSNFKSRCGIQVPEALHDTEREELIHAWLQSQEGKRLCDSSIPLDIMRSELRILGLSDHINDIKRSDQEAIFRFGYRTHSDRLIFLSKNRFDLSKKISRNKKSKSTTPKIGSKIHSNQQGKKGLKLKPIFNRFINIHAKNTQKMVKNSDIISNRSKTGQTGQTGQTGKTDQINQTATTSNKSYTLHYIPLIIKPKNFKDKNSSKTNVLKDSKQLPNYRLRLRYKVLDLHALRVTEVSTVNLTVNPKLSEAFSHHDFSSFIRHWFYLFPDAIHIGRSSIQMWGTYDHGRTQGMSFSITRISHPDAFARWDYELSLAPEIMADIFVNELDMGITRRSSIPKVINFRRWGGGIVANSIGHTPIGAIGLGLILGGVALVTKAKSDISMLYGIQASYTGFMGKRIFFRLESNYYVLDMNLKKLHINEGINILIAVGAHISEFSSWMRSLF
jgi:hypothetical protein